MKISGSLSFALLLLFGSVVVFAQSNPEPPDRTNRNGSIAKGTVRAFSVSDKQYGISRKVWVYTPAGYDDSKKSVNSLVISFDGEDYIKDIPAPVILDDLIASKKLDPVIQVFVDNSEDRLGDLANHRKFADFVALDLLPWIRSNFRVNSVAENTVLCGYSAGGLGAAYVAFRYPKLFGGVLSQSGAFWRGNEGSSSGFEWLTDQYQASPRLDIKFYLVVGGGETVANASGKSMVETNRHLRDVLKAKGNSVGYLEAPGGLHAPEYWKTQLADGLMFLLGKH